MDAALLDITFFCPGCRRPSVYLTGVTTDSVRCSDEEYCGWVGTTAEAIVVESLF